MRTEKRRATEYCGPERRRNRRRRVLHSATICCKDGLTIDCQIREISSDGGIVQLASGFGVPDRFELTSDVFDGRKAVRVLRRDIRMMAFVFE
jgi:hypothetical protein